MATTCGPFLHTDIATGNGIPNPVIGVSEETYGADAERSRSHIFCTVNQKGYSKSDDEIALSRLAGDDSSNYEESLKGVMTDYCHPVTQVILPEDNPELEPMDAQDVIQMLAWG